MLKIVEQSLLYDFYGELLTDHQKNIYEDVIINDLSVSEIARDQGITRQGVHDLVKRCDTILREYENKLHLVERFMKTKQDILEIQKLATDFQNTKNSELVRQIYCLSEKMLQDI